ncbi:hypothetical protein CEXT_592881 [Caerostris extrusa]|uniref:Uncharacterized protein n=1 Tax=Caerostris extrusa TaxID=172846 RepID=A0AAV4WUL0_CAEEX|nr:hypothetical protein CEXT_592881 [Caerostris extrusa]
MEPDGVPPPRAFLREPLIRVLWHSYRMWRRRGREADASRVINNNFGRRKEKVQHTLSFSFPVFPFEHYWLALKVSPE